MLWIILTKLQIDLLKEAYTIWTYVILCPVGGTMTVPTYWQSPVDLEQLSL